MIVKTSKKVNETFTLSTEEFAAIRKTISLLEELQENTEILDVELLKEVSICTDDLIQGLEKILEIDTNEYSTELDQMESST